MAKWMTLSEVLQIWRREFERESYGDSQAQSMGVAVDMVEDNSSQGSPGPSAVSPSTQPPPAAASANQDSPGPSAVSPSTQSPPAAASAHQDSPGSSAICPPSTQSPPAVAASAHLNSPAVLYGPRSVVSPPSRLSPPAVAASANRDSPASLYNHSSSVVLPPSRLFPPASTQFTPAVVASANLDSPASLYSPILSVVSPTTTESPPAVAVSANQDIPASLYSPGPSVSCPPSTKSPHPVAAHLQSSLRKWDYSQSPHGKRRVIDPESEEGWHDIIDEDEEPGQFPGRYAVCTPSKQSLAAAASAAASASPDSHGPSAVSPPPTQFLTAANTSAAATAAHLASSLGKWDNTKSPHAKRRKIDTESEEGWHDINDEYEEPGQFPGHSVVFSPSIRSVVAAEAASPGSPDSPYSPGSSAVPPTLTQSPPADAASPESPASPYSPGSSAVSHTTQSPPAVAASANPDSPASLYSPDPSVVFPPSTQSPPAVAASANSDSPASLYSPGPCVVSPPSTQSPPAVAASANSGSPASLYSPGPCAVSRHSTQSPPAVAASANTDSPASLYSPGPCVVSLHSTQSPPAVAASANSGSPASPYSPDPCVVSPPSTQSPLAVAASANTDSPASLYSPGPCVVSPPSTQSPPAVAASANSDSPASLYSPGPCVVSPPSTQSPPAVAASANTDSPASLYSPGPCVVSPPSTQSLVAVAASANSDSPASLYSPGPFAVFPPSTQSPPPVAASAAAAHLQSSLGKWDDSQSPHAKRRVMDPESEEGWHDINNEDEEPGQLPGNCAVCSPSTQSLAASAAASASPDSHGLSAVSPPSTQFLATAASAHPDIPGSSDFVPPSTQHQFSTSAIPDISGPADVSPPSTESVAASANPDSPGPAAVSLPSTQSPPVVASASPESPGPSAVSLPSTQSPLAAAAAAAVPPRRTPVKRTMGRDFQSPRRKRRVIDPDYEEGWHGINDEDEEPRQFPFHPRRTPGVQLDYQQNYSPLELFQLFFSKDAVKILCQNTNKNMERKRLQGFRTAHVFKEVTPGDMSKYISLVIYLGLVRPSSFRDLWRTDKLHSHYFPSSVMPGYKFMAIGSYLHMSDPAEDILNDQLRGQEGYDPLFRLKPLQNQILTACRAYYHPHQNLSIDERMVATKGRIGIKQFMKDKPTKWGFKLFVLADSKSGYTCDFSVYQGKAFTPSGNGLSYDAVVNLLRVPFLGTGYHLFVDNFYTSTALFRHLHQIRYGACGTMRENLTCFPKTTVNALPKRADRGDLRWIRDGPLLYVKWKDNKDVCLCSTIHKAYSGQSVQRRVRDPNDPRSTRAVPVPDPVVQYNKYMGGVDLSDALIKYYNVNQKTIRWYKKLFLHFVDIAVVNSYIIHKELSLIKGQRPMTQKRFRETLCVQLAKVGKHGSTRQEKVEEAVKMAAPKPQETVEEKKPPEAPVQEKKPFSCFPVTVTDVSGTDSRFKSTRGRRSCVLCSSRKLLNKTIYKCNSCDVPLCIVVDRICFTEWHNLKNSQAPSKM